MPDPLRRLNPTTLPPMILTAPRPAQVHHADALPQLTRIAYALAAFALPALGIAMTDTVHQTGVPGVRQAVASAVPSGEAAVIQTVPTRSLIRVTLRDRDLPRAAHRDVRS